jgi:hypothetical protein
MKTSVDEAFQLGIVPLGVARNEHDTHTVCGNAVSARRSAGVTMPVIDSDEPKFKLRKDRVVPNAYSGMSNK